MHISSIKETTYNKLSVQKNVSSSGINVHIVDGGAHGQNMTHYAHSLVKTINEDIFIQTHNVNVNKFSANLKQMDDLESVLKNMNESGHLKKGDYLTVPGLATVSLSTLSAILESFVGRIRRLTPDNVKSYKNEIVQMLKDFYDNNSFYSHQIVNLDSCSQGFEHLYGIISEINKMTDRGVNVYLPAGHPIESSVKWLASERGQKEKLYAYIASGKNQYRSDVERIFINAKESGCYNFNLLALSNAHIVNVNGVDDKSYLFSAYDSFVNDSARGVFNFYPVRDKSGEIQGYSYRDKVSLDYPYSEFPANEELVELNEFVAKNIYEHGVMATVDETKKFAEFLQEGKDTSELPNRLYKINEIYEQREIEVKNLGILGKFTNNKRNLIFDINNDGEIIFQKCNCEGSKRPSVLSMWGSCFSTLTAIVRDITNSLNSTVQKNAARYIEQGDRSNFNSAESFYETAIRIMQPNRYSLASSRLLLYAYNKLYEQAKSNFDSDYAKYLANTLVGMYAYNIKDLSPNNLQYIEIQKLIARLYAQIAVYCSYIGEEYPQRVCEWAVKELNNNTEVANKIIQRRAKGEQYIGDIYDACQ